MQAQPRLLHRVLGLAERPQHAVGHGPQVPAVLSNGSSMWLRLGHCHILPSRFVIQITDDIGRM